MNKGANIEQDLAEAEAALLKVESEFGLHDIRVSYALDNMARLLRENGLRTLDAVNMEARAKSIRIKINQSDMAKVTPQMRDVSDAVKYASKRQQKEKSNKALWMVACVLICGSVVAKVILAPSAAERKTAELVMERVKAVLPTTMVQNMIEKGKVATKEVQEANKKHNDQIEQIMQGNLAGDASESAGK